MRKLSILIFLMVISSVASANVELIPADRKEVVRILKSANLAAVNGQYRNISVECNSGMGMSSPSCILDQGRNSQYTRSVNDADYLRRMTFVLKKAAGYEPYEMAYLYIHSCSISSCVVSIESQGGAASF